MIKRLILSAVMFAVLLVTSVSAQIIYGQPASGSIRVVYTDWSLEEEGGKTTLSQLAVPVNAFVPMGENLEARFYIANASNDLDERGTAYSLSGLSDTRIMFNHSFNDDRFLAGLGINLPVGKKSLSLEEEWIVIDYLSDNYLSFPMRRFGEGFGVSLLLGAATMIGEAHCGAGLMYQYNGTYEPYDGYDKYNPGDLLSFNVGTEITRNNLTLTGDLAFTFYTADKVEGAKVLQQGNQVDFRLNSYYDNEMYSISAGIRYLLRGEQTNYDPATESELQKLKSYGNEFAIDGTVSWFPVKNWYIAPSLEYRTIAANEKGFDNSKILGYGGAIGRSLGEKLNLDIGIMLYTGDADGGIIDLTGYRITGGIVSAF